MVLVKTEILQRSQPAKKYNNGKETVLDILRKEAELQSFVANADSAKALSKRRILKRPTFQQLDDIMS